MSKASFGQELIESIDHLKAQGDGKMAVTMATFIAEAAMEDAQLEQEIERLKQIIQKLTPPPSNEQH